MLADVLSSYGYGRVDAREVYSDMFKLEEGWLQDSYRANNDAKDFKSNPIILGETGKRIRRRILYRDTFFETLDEFSSYEWAFISGCTYFGKANVGDRQSKLFALIFDLDGVDDQKLTNFLFGMGNGVYPEPQFLVLSGHGVHLYYIFEEPIELFPEIKLQMKELKYALTRRLWNQYTSTIKTPQYQGINQGFRAVGSKTKLGTEVIAYRINTHPTDIFELNQFVDEEVKVSLPKRYKPSKYSIEEAKEKFPEWYERVVVNGEPVKRWHVKEDLYNWWLRKLQMGSGVIYGHRYFCVMTLAIFAVKCNLVNDKGEFDRERVFNDAKGLIPVFNQISPEHPFTEADIESALECLDGRFATFPRNDLARISAISMPANKRNYRKQSLHLRMARSNLEILNEDAGKALQGRPEGSGTLAMKVWAYKFKHPDMSNRKIADELGISRNTVNKWLKISDWKEQYQQEIQPTNSENSTESSREQELKELYQARDAALLEALKRGMAKGATEKDVFNALTIMFQTQQWFNNDAEEPQRE